jgi:hypothetical protein
MLSLYKKIENELYELTKDGKGTTDTKSLYTQVLEIMGKSKKKSTVEAKFEITFGHINQDALKILNDLMLSPNNDKLRQLELDAIIGQMVGYNTYKQTAKILSKLIREQTELTEIKNADGSILSIEEYSLMVARTTSAEIHREATKGRILKLFRSDVIELQGAKDEKNAPACAKYVNQLLSMTGQVKELPTLQQYINEGGFHPNCRHNVGVTLKVIQYYEDNNIDY